MSDTTAGSRRGAIRIAGATIRENDLPTTSEAANVVGCKYRTAYAGLNRREDALPPENMRVQCELALSTDVPLATGKKQFRVHDFAELVQEFSVDILTPRYEHLRWTGRNESDRQPCRRALYLDLSP